MFAYGETVTRHRTSPGIPPYYEDAGDDTLAFLGCAIWQESSVEPGTDAVDGRAVVVTVTKAALPFDADVKSGDIFEARGVTYEVIGEPERVHSPLTGWEPGCVITGRRVDD